MTRQWWLAIGVVAILAFAFLTSGFARYHCGRCADQRTTFDLFLIPIIEIEPHYDEYGIVADWERAHGRRCVNLWQRGPFNPERTDRPYFPTLHFRAAVVQHRVAAEALMLTKTPQELNRQDALGRTPMHWIAAASGIGPMREQVLARGVRLDIRDEDGLTPLDWDWRARAKIAPR
jgi:hypothetical protein